MRVVVERDELSSRYDPEHAWIATEFGIDLGVPTGTGATPLRAIEQLLWALNQEHISPADVEIEWS